MSAQDNEMILDTGDGGQADIVARIEDSEDENNPLASTQSTWKGCQSDDDADVGASSTPQCKVDVVIYTPSKTWISVETQANSQPSPPLENPILDEGDDNVSVFSMSHHGSLEPDPRTDNELDEIQATPKITRRVTSSNSQTTVFHELGPFTPRNRRSSSSLPRDSKGRFTSNNPSLVSSSSVKSKSRRNSISSNSATASLVRDANGRFAPKNGTPGTPFAKRRASMGSSASEKVPLSLIRNVHGKFAPKSGPSANTLIKRRASMGSSTLEPHSLEPDSKGRFASKKETPIPPPKPLAKRRSSTSASPDGRPAPTRDITGKLAPNETPVLPPTKSTPVKDLESPLPEVDMDDKPPTRAKLPSKSAKTKKAPAKSPYFVPPTPPISPELTRKSKVQAANKPGAASEPTTPRKENRNANGSPVSGKKSSLAKTVSCIPFPPLSAPHFGLIQEKLAHDPFRLLIAVTFLIRTHGKHAIPVFFDLMEKYPTPESLVAADKEEIVPIIRHLGLQNQRASTYQMYANIWLEDSPTKGKRYPVRGYPNPESGRDVKKGEILSDKDERHAWEIGHVTQGPYAIDSWRIFCRDKLRGEADGWNGEGRGEGFQPEWMRVLPGDKELRAYLRWMWLKEGFEWDPFTGDKEVARPELMRAAMEGRIAWDNQGGMRILDEPMSASPSKSDSDAQSSQVSTPPVRDDELA